MNWYTADEDHPEEVERVMAAWPGAPVDNLEVLGMILDTARDQVIAYAPDSALDATGKPIKRLVYAQLQQAVNLWNASSVNSSGEVGPEGYSFTPRPLDKTIRTIIRPQSGKPSVL